MRRLSLLSPLFLVPLAAVGCTPEDEHEHEGVAVSLAFNAKLGAAPFSCAETYDDVGTSGSTLTPADFRFYVHDVRLVDDAGTEHAVTLDTDDFQSDGLALLDFENGSGTCSDAGTAGTHTAITGTVEHDGTFTGLRFTLGVPFEQNHQNPANAPAPLKATGMQWNWQGGFKFLKFDATTTGLAGGYFVHLGSTACDGDPATGGVTSCANENRVDIALDGFDPTATATIVDVGALLAGSDVNVDGGGPPGCMSGPTDPECPALFARFGLPFGETPAGTQTLFRAP